MSVSEPKKNPTSPANCSNCRRLVCSEDVLWWSVGVSALIVPVLSTLATPLRYFRWLNEAGNSECGLD
ncbi:hypothetical protein LX36DRAFT_295347 [Colletotrichum falcatum]|nr:hypothetical protein LX36DRAFT_295347 [Colletotrichum falcatum]